jgi:hypothetical protein
MEVEMQDPMVRKFSIPPLPLDAEITEPLHEIFENYHAWCKYIDRDCETESKGQLDKVERIAKLMKALSPIA